MMNKIWVLQEVSENERGSSDFQYVKVGKSLEAIMQYLKNDHYKERLNPPNPLIVTNISNPEINKYNCYEIIVSYLYEKLSHEYTYVENFIVYEDEVAE